MSEQSRPEVIAVIPAYGEELTIASVVILTKAYVDQVIVVDDGSKDRTSIIAEAAGAKVLKHEVNQGKAKALLNGLIAAKAMNPEAVVLLDGDGQMEPSLIPQVLQPIKDGTADMVIGSRYKEKDGDTPKHRRVGQKVLDEATAFGSGIKLTDTQSGYRALSRKALDHLDFPSQSYGVESDMIVHFHEKGLRIVEVPVHVRYDVPKGHKKGPLKHGLSVLGRVIGQLGFRRPLISFGIPGLILMLVGFILGLLTFFDVKVLFNWTLSAQAMVALSLLGIGLFLFLAALVLNSLNIQKEHKPKK